MDTIYIVLLLCIGLHTITADTSDEKCCDDLGCFELGQPWSSLLRPIPPPKCPDECPATFYMFSRQNPSENLTISEWPIDSFDSTFFDNTKTTVFATHGWRNSWSEMYEKIKDAYLERADVNFIFLDWSSCSYDRYLQAVSTLRIFAAQGIRFIRYLINNHGMSECKLHLIGFSLGAHLVAYIGKEFINKETNTTCVERLTGLEPAAPLFQGYSEEVQLVSSDAQFVEVAHTETIPIVGPGERRPQGDVDHYFNGNIHQPGCFQESTNDALQKLHNGDFDAFNLVAGSLVCGHERVLEYYAAALKKNNCTFWGERKKRTVQALNQLTLGLLSESTSTLEQCTIDSCSPFGMKAIEYPARGEFSVATNDEEPYCIPNPEVDKRMEKLLEEYKEEHDNK